MVLLVSVWSGSCKVIVFAAIWTHFEWFVLVRQAESLAISTYKFLRSRIWRNWHPCCKTRPKLKVGRICTDSNAGPWHAHCPGMCRLPNWKPCIWRCFGPWHALGSECVGFQIQNLGFRSVWPMGHSSAGISGLPNSKPCFWRGLVHWTRFLDVCCPMALKSDDGRCRTHRRWIQDGWLKIQEACFKIQVTRFKIEDRRVMIPDSRSQI